jgi:hypothetical protein
MSDQVLLSIDDDKVGSPELPKLVDENTPVIIHFSVGDNIVEGNPIIPITLVGNVPCVGFFVSTKPNLPPNPVWSRYPQQTFDLNSEL